MRSDVPTAMVAGLLIIFITGRSKSRISTRSSSLSLPLGDVAVSVIYTVPISLEV